MVAVRFETAQKLATLRQYLTTIIGCFSLVIAGTAAGWPSPTIIKMKNHEAPFSPTTDQISWAVSILYIGHLLSPLPSGVMMDRLGRKHTCVLLGFLPLISWLLICSTTSVIWLYVARLIIGLWGGAISTIVPIYVGEIAEPKLRGSLMTFNHLMRKLGVVIVYILGPYVSYTDLALICSVLTFVYIVLLLYTPESPYYLMMAGRDTEAYATLNWLRGNRGEPFVDEELAKMKSAYEKQIEQKGSFKDILYNKGNRKALIISEVYAVSRRLTGGSVLQSYASLTLPPLTFGLLKPDECVIILGLVSLVAAVVSVLLAVHFNRRSLISYSSAGCGITMALVSVWYYLDTRTSFGVKNYSDWLFICMILYNSAFSVGLGSVGTSIKGELFAINVKAICSSLTTISVALMAFILNKFFLSIADNLGMYVNFLIYSLSCIFILVFTFTYVPETQGKTLEEIQRILHRSN